MNNGDTRKKIYKILVGIVFCMLAGVYIFGMVFQLYIKKHYGNGLGGWCESYKTGWERVYEDGTRKPLDYPVSITEGGNKDIVVENVLPDNLPYDWGEAQRYISMMFLWECIEMMIILYRG